MVVTLQLTLGIFLILSQWSLIAQGVTARDYHEAAQSTSTPPIQNATEINNRDLNKIATDNPKTDLLDSKLKPVNNVNNLDIFPPIFGSIKPDDETSDVDDDEDDSKSKEDTKEDLFKEKFPKPVDIDSKKFWARKNVVYTAPPSSDVEKIHEDEDDAFEGIREHYNIEFAKHTKLTTPKNEIFDQKFKETVESVDQGIEEGYRTNKDRQNEFLLDDTDEESSKVNGTSSNEFIQTKSIIKNETIDKNSIHKDLDIEQIKRINYDSSFNDTVSYNEETTKGETYEPSSTTEKISGTSPRLITTRKPSLMKTQSTERINNQILSNKIETETRKPIKENGSSTALPESTKKPKGELENAQSTLKTVRTEPTSTTVSSTSLRSNVSDQENHIIPDSTSTKKAITEIFSDETSSITLVTTDSLLEASETTENSKITDVTHNITSRLVEDDVSTTENLLTSTTEEQPETTTVLFTTTLPETTTEELVTELVKDDFLEITSEEDEVSTTEPVTTESPQRTSKSLENTLVPDQATRSTEINLNSTTKVVEISTVSTTVVDIESTTFSERIRDNVIVKVTTELPETTTVLETTTVTVPTLISSTEEPVKTPEITTEVSETSQGTTEFKFIHIEDSGINHTTLHPETLGPGLNYSTPSENGATLVRKIVHHDLLPSETTTPGINNVTSTDADEDNTIPTESLTKDGGDNKGKIAAIAISSVGAVCLVILAGLLYVMKKRQRRLNYGPRCRPVSLDDYSIDNLSVYNSMRRKNDRMSKRSFGNPAFEDPTSPTHPLNFPALAKFSTNFDDIRAEYEEIPQITAKTSELPEDCDSKNRYANVIPLPETRVYLKHIDGYENSDYINANYVTGPKNTRGYYIATQGPLQSTVDDFWRMVWEQQSKVILMLTHLVENGLEKCVDYLPESEVINCNRSFGDFQIVLKRREVKEKYIISSLQLKNMVSNSWREITHFWYLGWPEKGVPSEANSLIAFLIEARSYMKTTTLDHRNGDTGVHNGMGNSEHNPVVVHCSPGTGRTGVAIACDIAIREFESTRMVDIPKIVYRIRRDRAGAVQSKEQYQFIYKVVSLYATKLTGGALENF